LLRFLFLRRRAVSAHSAGKAERSGGLLLPGLMAGMGRKLTFARTAGHGLFLAE